MEIRRAYHLVGVLEAIQARDGVGELVLDVDAGGCEAGVGREAGDVGVGRAGGQPIVQRLRKRQGTER